MTKRVCILTDFYEADSTYSLNIIAEAQINMALDAGYPVVGVVSEGFKPVRAWERIELRPTPPPKERKNHVEFYPQIGDDVKATKAALDEVLADVDVIITHDLIYQSAIMPLNFAARAWAQQNPHAVWLNWVHSATPSPIWTTKDRRLEPLQRHFPNSKVCFPNSWDVPRVARAFRCEISDVAVVPHPTNVPEYLGFQDVTKRLCQERDLLNADVIMVYPVRLDRGKQVEKVMRVAAALKHFGKSVRVICVDFHSTGGDKVDYRRDLKKMMPGLGLNEAEVTFTSEFDEELHLRAPREVVRDLMLLCNVFVQASVSETYSLIAQEAGLCGAFLVLNRDFPAFRTIYGQHASYFQFSSAVNALTGEDGTTEVNYDNIDDYFRNVAGRVAYELQYNPVLAQRTRIRKERNPAYVFKRYIEPLFYFKDGLA